jgi:uncharacterized coiled-coil protein SlyX
MMSLRIIRMVATGRESLSELVAALRSQVEGQQELVDSLQSQVKAQQEELAATEPYIAI